MLFDSGADYSLVSTTFMPLLEIKPNSLCFSYEIEIASGQLVEINKVIHGCKLEIEGHTFDIDLILFEHGSFDVIIGMDWLSRHIAEIVCQERVVRIPLPRGEVLRVYEERPEEKKNKKYVWGDEQEMAFQTLKDKLCNALILALLDGPEDFVVYCNVSCQGLDEQMERRSDGALYYMDRIWVPLMGDIRTLIMDELHKLRYSVHPGLDKMYYDHSDMYWWPGMKKDIALYVRKCLTCLKVKAEHHKPSSLLQQPEILEWKWERITIDFITKLP
ncbi:putative reverse transcriptase domain-containing protein [Tanacetum coccineum]